MLVLLMMSSGEYGETTDPACRFSGRGPLFHLFLGKLGLCHHSLGIADDTFYIGYTKFVIVLLLALILYFDYRVGKGS